MSDKNASLSDIWTLLCSVLQCVRRDDTWSCRCYCQCQPRRDFTSH